MLKKFIEMMTVVAVFVFTVGCMPKNPGNTIHNDVGKSIDIVEQISDDCIKNKDTQGAKEAWDTYLYLNAFYCQPWTDVKYDDVKNRKYEKIEFDMGELQIAVAAYNEYNDESAMDIEVGWIRQFSTCTQEQHDAIEAYVEWYYTGQNVTADGLIRDYENEFYNAYEGIQNKYDITQIPSMYKLTPSQFKEVQNYMADPENYQVDTSLWE